MNILPPIQEGFYRWIDSVASTVNGLLNRLQSNHEVRIIESAHDTFTLRAAGPGRKSNVADHRIRIINGTIRGQLPADWAKMLRGSRAEMVLNANRFLFRPLELPKRAVEFLDGIVRAQIDRLTPWTPGEAVFSWTPPTDGPNDRIELTIAATARLGNSSGRNRNLLAFKTISARLPRSSLAQSAGSCPLIVPLIIRIRWSATFDFRPAPAARNVNVSGAFSMIRTSWLDCSRLSSPFAVPATESIHR